MFRPAIVLVMMLLFSAGMTAELMAPLPLTEGLMPKGAAQCDLYWMKPCVGDDASVSFIAPDPDNSLPNAWGAYRLPATSDDAYDTLFRGNQAFFSASCFELVHAPHANAHFVIRTINSTTGARELQLEYRAADGTHGTSRLTDLNGNSSPAQVRLACSADASRVALTTASGLLVRDVQGTTFSPVTTIPEAIQGSLALSADGNLLVYSTRDEETGGRLLCLRDLRGDAPPEKIKAIGDTDPQVACSAETTTIVLRSNSGSLTNGSGNHIVLLTRCGSSWQAKTLSASLGEDIDAGEPCLSADGQTVLFTAKDKDDVRQIYLWRATDPDAPTPLTATTADCRVPALSPSGRFLVFAIADTPAQLYMLDLGLSLEAGDATLLLGQDTPLPLKTNARPTATLTLAADYAPLPGTLLDASGNAVPLGTPLEPAQLPLSFAFSPTASLQPLTLTATLTEGDTTLARTFTLTPTPLLCLSLPADSTPPSSNTPHYTALDTSDDGNVVVFSTNANLHPADGGRGNDIYRRDMATNTLTLLTDADTFPHESLTCAIAGDASRIVLVCDNKLQDSTGAILDTDVSHAVQPSLSRDGATIAYATDTGTLRLIVNGQSPVTLHDTAEVTDVALNDDGTILAFLQQDGQLWATSTTSPAPFRLASHLTHLTCLSLTFNGATAAVLTDQGQFYTLPVYPEASPTLHPDLKDAQNVRLSPNGRFALFSRESEGLWQLHRLNLVTREERCLTYHPDCGYGNGDSNSTPLLPQTSHDGETVLFLSTLTNLAPGDSPPNLFAWRNPTPVNTPPTLQSQTLTVDEIPDDLTLALASDTTSEADYPIPVLDPDGDETDLLDATAAKGTVILLPRNPATAQIAPRLLYTPPSPHFVGTETLTLHLTDGTTPADQTLTLVIQNLNDPPLWQEQPPLCSDSADGSLHLPLTLPEGETYTLDTASYVYDPDLLNPAPDTDALTFALPADAPAWLSIDSDSGLLTIAPDFTVASRLDNNGKSFSFPLTATDRAGASATLSLRLTVTHVNRPPALAVDSFALMEGTPLSWEDLSPSDPDDEDDDEALALHFSSPPQHGHFTDAAGQPIPAADLTAGLVHSRFPITFIAAPDAVNGENLSLYASDVEGATSPSIPFDLTFHRQQIPVTQWWPSTTTENGSLVWTNLTPGWNLLASPVDLDATSLDALLAWLNADQLWLFRHGSYVTTASANALPCAHEGFWAFLPTTPKTTDFAFVGNRPSPPDPLPHGWSLRTREAILTHHPDHEIYLLQQNSLRLVNASDLPSPASPAWLYLP
ncbi:MAG: putative Ig domain-containing protein [Oligosphaeraceae bacterium]